MKSLVFCTLLMAVSMTAAAQDKYPSRPITLIVGYAAGGGGEVVARLVADYAREKRGAIVTVEFRPGAGATIAADQLARAKPDGYTVSTFSGNPLLAAPHLQKVPYDPLKDFTYMATFFAISNAAFVRTDSPFKSFADVVAYARANPGKLRSGRDAYFRARLRERFSGELPVGEGIQRYRNRSIGRGHQDGALGVSSPRCPSRYSIRRPGFAVRTIPGRAKP